MFPTSGHLLDLEYAYNTVIFRHSFLETPCGVRNRTTIFIVKTVEFDTIPYYYYRSRYDT